MATEILPLEARIRVWFLQRGVPPDDVDDVMQEAYFRMVALNDVAHITNPAGYFFSIIRNLVSRLFRHPQTVAFETVMEFNTSDGHADWSAENTIGDRLTVEKVKAIIASLPPRCRQIVELRKIEGWSQKEIASHLGMTEKAVEKQIWLGVGLVRDIWSQAEERMEARVRRAEGSARLLERAGS